MTTQLQLRRDSTTNIQAMTPAQGEPIYDTVRKSLVLGDGSTGGGNTVTPFSGTWTPQLNFAGGHTGMTISAGAVGWYMVIGQLCYINFAFQLTAKGSSTGAAEIAGLPFASAAISTVYDAIVISSHSNMNTSDVFECGIQGGSQSIQLVKGDATTAAALADTDFTNTTFISGSGWYQIAQPSG